MMRAIVIFLLVLGIVGGGLALLRRTAGTPQKNYKRRPDTDEDDRSSW